MKKKQNPQRRPMTACERGVWIDTEGHIETTPKGVYRIDIWQEDKEALEDYCAGAINDSVPCIVDPKAYRVRITGASNVAKEIKLTEQCIRTARKRAQIQRFKTAITRELKYRPKKVILEARKILEL